MNASGVTNSQSDYPRDLPGRRLQRWATPRRYVQGRVSLRATRHAVTLIELLITITIIATLSATFLGVSRSAMESSRAARTKTLISKLHGLLMEKWSTYATRRVDVSQLIKTNLQNNIQGSALTKSDQRRALGLAQADLRLLALRELMMLELPDSWSDILLQPIGSNPMALDRPRILNAYPAVRQTYLRRYREMLVKTPLGTGDNSERILQNQGAECLYLIIMLATGDGEARTLFNEQDIGDTDDDGAPEFLDGWGRPIHFIRWPAGFAVRSELMSGDADSDGDPFDMFRRHQPGAKRPVNSLYPINPIWIEELKADPLSHPAYRLVPLIYSAGPDGETDIDDVPYFESAPPTSLDPYAVDPNTPDELIVGTYARKFVFGLPYDLNEDGDDNSLDNIHNHLQDNR